MLPFALLLLAIAVMPFAAAHWWHRYYPLVAVGLGAITAGYYLFGLGAYGQMLHLAHEYVSFIALIGSLFVVAGGIHITVKGEATPVGNVIFLFLGAVLANVIGTTGAAILLIRPWIRMNHYRATGFHVVFFIFLVANVGGGLTPIGDPPLFLGFLRGVPFWWVVEHCLVPWAVAVAALLAIFLVLDTRNFRRAPRRVQAEMTASSTWRFCGGANVLFLAVILAGVFLPKPAGLREVLMIGAAVGSYFSTARDVHAANDFNFHPIKEVAWLFLGIFATMAPALDYLQLHGPELGLTTPLRFYTLTGLLSGFLDNAPTYLTFLAAALGNHGWSIDDPAHVRQFVEAEPRELMAISLGAVFFGALTYIGNGPNFMVKAIAEHAKVKVPGFFGYLVKYALPFLVPVLALVAVLFFW
jgi:Na+/H+ antiporter NhaD/arsenite permease-like protein